MYLSSCDFQSIYVIVFKVFVNIIACGILLCSTFTLSNSPSSQGGRIENLTSLAVTRFEALIDNYRVCFMDFEVENHSQTLSSLFNMKSKYSLEVQLM